MLRLGDWMRSSTSVLCPIFLFAILQAVAPSSLLAGQTDTTALAAATVPDSPDPQIYVAQAAGPQSTESATSRQAPAPQPASSQSQPQGATQQTQHQKAEEQLKQQETQRVAGIMATFNTTRNPDALPLSPDQKFRLFFKSAFDPWPFGLSAVVAGIGQADDSYEEWGQGAQGYAKRFGAAYSDYFLGNFFGNAVLPSLLHEDPRYYQKGSGKPINRMLWAASSTVWCKRDRGGWGPNWANVGGNLIGSAIARTYYPASYRTVSDTITDGLTVSVEGIVGAEVIEFWPDVVRHYQRKKAEKQAAMDAAKGQKKEAEPQDRKTN